MFCAPGNAGTGVEHNISNVKLNPSDHDQVIRFCREKDIGFVVVGPEQPLVEGLVDSLTRAGITAFGPSASAARLEGSKEFMKNLCRKYDIPTATYEVFDNPADAKAYVKRHGAPIVVKTSGLAAGKGVILCQTVDEATKAIDDMIKAAESMKYGIIIMATLPMLILYLSLQKYFEKGITMGSVKG